MKNPVCLWCGEEMEKAVCGTAPVEYVCEADNCVAKGVCLPEKMTKLPAELEAWHIEYSFPLQEDCETMVAGWLGLFANEELAMEAGEKAFGKMDNAGNAFEWDIEPVVFVFQGGV